MAVNATYLDAIANNGKTLITHLSLHTAATPSTANEVTGAGYARQAVTWGATSAGDFSATGTPVASFTVPAGVTVASVGYNNAVTVGTFYGGETVTSETFGASGAYDVNSVTIAHDPA